MAKKTTGDSDIAEIKDIYEQCQDAWAQHHERYLEDYRFTRLNQQWPTQVENERKASNRPCLTINKVNPIIKQIVNDCRQNKPAIKVRPADDTSDPHTAEVYSGLIRNIEQVSGADAAYDTAVDCAASGGFGFFRVRLDYAHDDSFDLDILVDRIANPLSVYGDPFSTAVDSSDWNHAFITDIYSEEAFKDRWPKAEAVSWDGSSIKQPNGAGKGQEVQVAEYWCRKEVPKIILKLSDGTVLGMAEYQAQKDILDAQGITVTGSRQIKGKAVYQKIISGAEILEEIDWPGMWIPIIPVYGDELNEEGQRIFLSATYYAKDAQRRYNYWTTTSTELVALAPKVPFIGPEQAFQGEDRDKWASANTSNLPYISYKGPVAPARQPLDSGPAVGAMQEALVASDEIKATTGVYDASLGARSNETSGRAINARKVEGDTATFHFTDNLSRGIRHCGRILIDLIPKVYKQDRMIRVLGEDGSAQTVKLGPAQPGTPPAPGQRPTFDGVYDLAAGKYDLVVDTGPSYTTQRMETAEQIMTFIQSAPEAAARVGDILFKNLDWKDADLIAERLKPANEAPIPPEVQAQIEQGKQIIDQLSQENEKLKQSQTSDMAAVAKAQADQDANALKREELGLERLRLPIEDKTKQIDLLTAQKDLLIAEANLVRARREATAPIQQ